MLRLLREAESGRKLRVLRTDNGGEFTAAEFAAYCADEGIQRHYSAPYSPQQNGVVERRNQTVVGDGSGPPQAEGGASFVLGRGGGDGRLHPQPLAHQGSRRHDAVDRKSTRLNSSHEVPSRMPSSA